MCIIDFLNYQPFGYDKSVAVVALIYGVFWFIVYNVYVLWHINGIGKDNREIKIIPISISQSYYMIDVRWLFQMFMWSSLFSIILIGQNVLFGIAGLLFAIMTCNPSVNGGDVFYIPHVLCAVGAISISLLGLLIVYNLKYYFIFCVLSIIISYIATRKKVYTIYIIELVSLTDLMVGLFLSLL